MSTYKQIQDKILFFFGVADSESKDQIKNFINDIISEINSEIPNAIHIQKRASITCTLSTSLISNAFPSDYDHILNIHLLDSDGKQMSPLIFLTRDEWNAQRYFDSGSGIPRYYNIWDGELYIAPLPEKAYSGYIDYYQYESELVNDIDTCSITDHYPRWERLITDGVKWLFNEYLNIDQNAIIYFENKFHNGILRFRAWTKRNLNLKGDASRIRGWKENQIRLSTLLPREFRRN